MIDATQEVPSAAVHRRHQAGRSSASRPNDRNLKPSSPGSRKSLAIERVFSDANVKPFEQVEWERRTAEINDDSGKVIFKQENVEVPKSWSQLATKVVVSKCFYGER